jgi:hypothetical protein
VPRELAALLASAHDRHPTAARGVTDWLLDHPGRIAPPRRTEGWGRGRLGRLLARDGRRVVTGGTGRRFAYLGVWAGWVVRFRPLAGLAGRHAVAYKQSRRAVHVPAFDADGREVGCYRVVLLQPVSPRKAGAA